MSLPVALIQIRKAKDALQRAEEELLEDMKTLGIKADVQPKPPGRPFGSKNRPKGLQAADVAPGEAQDESKAG